jgi:hypothetical protein
MKIGVLGSGSVGQAIAGKLAASGHEVMLGTRDPQKMEAWRRRTGERAAVGLFSQAAQFGEVLFNATSGQGALQALHLAGEEHLAGKLLMELSNPADFSRGLPPRLFVCNDDSLGERIQREFPKAKVVKTLNTVAAPLMVDPAKLADGDHHIFVCGDDADARAEASEYLKQ